MPAHQAANVGGYGVVPKNDAEKTSDYDMHVTVLAPGGGIRTWLGVVLLHVACWVAAIVLGGLTYLKIRDIATANEQMKTLSLVAPIVYVTVVFAVLVHSSCMLPPKPPGESSPAGDPRAPVQGAILLGIVAFALMMSFAVIATSAVLGDAQTYMMAVLAGLFVCLGGMMVFSFYVNFTAYGDNYRSFSKKLYSTGSKAAGPTRPVNNANREEA
jgi:hypothetical protein